MVSYTISHQAYVKIALHAAKYPHRLVNGVLIGDGKGGSVDIVDAVPLLHHWTSLSPSMEIGIDLVSVTFHCKSYRRLPKLSHERRGTTQNYFNYS